MDTPDDNSAAPGTDLLWGSRKREPRGPKPSLSVERIVRAAIELADTEGLDTLSIQRLAKELGAGAMSLYRYISSKDELISLMLDTAIGEPRTAPDGTDWRTALTHWAHQNLAVFQRHPWALSLVTAPRVMGPNETQHLEEGLRAISELGLSPTEMLDTVLLVNGYVRGSAPYSVGPVPRQADVIPDGVTNTTTVERYDKQHLYPTLMTVMKATGKRKKRARNAPSQFDYGLQRILDGIEAFVEERS